MRHSDKIALNTLVSKYGADNVNNQIKKINESIKYNSNYNSVGRGVDEVYKALSEVDYKFYNKDGKSLTLEEMENALSFFLDKYYENERMGWSEDDEYDEDDEY